MILLIQTNTSAKTSDMAKKIFILLGHPDKVGMCGNLATAYEEGARSAGHEVQRLNLGEMQFDPILHKGYRAIQDLEPDLKKFQEFVNWCDHLVIIYPVWWVGMPALLKGLFDRAWLPGSAFRYMKMPSGKRSMFWHRLYRGKTARTILTSGTPPWLVRLLPGNVNAQLKWGILWFAGFSVRSMWLGPAENVPEIMCTKWCDRVRELGKRGA
jgi:NAD(P)H dehydrogenase (quinone)